MPLGMRDLFEQHGDPKSGDEWEELTPDSDKLVTWEQFLKRFVKCSKIYGYLTDDYMEKWRQMLSFIESLAREEEHPHRPLVWVLFFCTDSDIVYSLYLNKEANKADVKTMLVSHS